MRAWHWVAGLVAAMAVGYVFWYRYLHVKVRLSTEAGIRAAVPAELLPPPKPPDLAARRRFDRLCELGNSIEADEQFDGEEEDEPTAKVTRVLREAVEVVRQGAIEADPAHRDAIGDANNIINGLGHEARYQGKRADSVACEKALESSFLVSLSLKHAADRVGSYRFACSLDEDTVQEAANAIRMGRLRPYELRRLISDVPILGAVDEDLRRVYRQELEDVLFHKNGGLIATARAELEGKSTPNVDPEAPGNFDVLATAKLLAALYGEWIANAGRPLDSQSSSVEALISMEFKELPSDEPVVATTPSKPDILKYKMQLNAIPNSNGIQFVELIPDEGADVRNYSIEVACENELLRLLAAVWADKEEHGGAFPSRLGQLVSGGYLREIPTDLFNGKRLLYNPATHAIYSVGPNMKDDGGALRRDIQDQEQDFGFLAKPSPDDE